MALPMMKKGIWKLQDPMEDKGYKMRSSKTEQHLNNKLDEEAIESEYFSFKPAQRCRF